MKNDLLKTAYSELKKLRKEQPTWSTFEKISILSGVIDLLGDYDLQDYTETDEMITYAVDSFGEEITIQKLKIFINSLLKDIDCIAPSVSAKAVNDLRNIIKGDRK